MWTALEQTIPIDLTSHVAAIQLATSAFLTKMTTQNTTALISLMLLSIRIWCTVKRWSYSVYVKRA